MRAVRTQVAPLLLLLLELLLLLLLLLLLPLLPLLLLLLLLLLYYYYHYYYYYYYCERKLRSGPNPRATLLFLLFKARALPNTLQVARTAMTALAHLTPARLAHTGPQPTSPRLLSVPVARSVCIVFWVATGQLHAHRAPLHKRRGERPAAFAQPAPSQRLPTLQVVRPARRGTIAGAMRRPTTHYLLLAAHY